MEIHCVQIDLEFTGYFKFLLPAQAFDSKRDELIELSVEYGMAEKGIGATANVWARAYKRPVRAFVYSIEIPAKSEFDADLPGKIIDALNADSDFNEVMKYYTPFLLDTPN